MVVAMIISIISHLLVQLEKVQYMKIPTWRECRSWILSVFKDWKRGFACSHHMEFVYILTILFCKSKIESRWELLLSASGVASGWHGWTMSRGPRAKGALKDREKREERKKKKRKENGGAWAPESPLSMGPKPPRYATAVSPYNCTIIDIRIH